MLPILAAALMQPTAATPVPATDPDLHCMAAYLFAVGTMSEDPAVKDDEKAGATSIVLYFFGKVRGRLPDADVKAGIKALVEAPDYLGRELKPDLERCADEFAARGKELETFDE